MYKTNMSALEKHSGKIAIAYREWATRYATSEVRCSHIFLESFYGERYFTCNCHWCPQLPQFGPCLVLKKNLQNFLDSPSHRIFRCMHEVLNIGENKN